MIKSQHAIEALFPREILMFMNRTLLTILFLLAAQSGPVLACDAVNTCKDIAWCMLDSNGREFAAPLRDAASKGQGDQVGGDASACQSKYGQQSAPANWGSVSAGCLPGDYTPIGKKALGGQPACD
jgi:hypothetical protein